MKCAKIKKSSNKKEIVVESDSYSLKKFLLIIAVIFLILGIFYLITIYVVKNKTNDDESTSYSVIDSEKILLSNLLSKSDEKYFVIATKDESNNGYADVSNTTIYNKYINDYENKEDSIKFYRVDLSSALNKNFIGDELVITDDLSSMKLNDDVLFEISNGKIDKYYVGSSEIIEKLSLLKEE